MVSLQAIGAAAGNMIAIHNVVAASATVGLLGQEGKTLRMTIIPTLYYVAGAGVLGLVAAYGLQIRRSADVIHRKSARFASAPRATTIPSFLESTTTDRFRKAPPSATKRFRPDTRRPGDIGRPTGKTRADTQKKGTPPKRHPLFRLLLRPEKGRFVISGTSSAKPPDRPLPDPSGKSCPTREPAPPRYCPPAKPPDRDRRGVCRPHPVPGRREARKDGPCRLQGASPGRGGRPFPAQTVSENIRIFREKKLKPISVRFISPVPASPRSGPGLLGPALGHLDMMRHSYILSSDH
jgi:hypothetical protein